MSEHTPTPWVLHAPLFIEPYITAKDTILIATAAGILNESHANAAFIVQAVNAHDKLVAAAQKVLDGLNARIDHACSVKAPLPVFDGIADLHSALASIKETA